MFKLPRLTTDIDCEPIGYPGLRVTCWLNITYEDWKAPENPQPWETLYFFGTARIIEALTIPSSMTNSGQDETIEIDNAKAVYDLMNEPGFDQSIITWALSQYQDKRLERMKAESKN